MSVSVSMSVGVTRYAPENTERGTGEGKELLHVRLSVGETHLPAVTMGLADKLQQTIMSSRYRSGGGGGGGRIRLAEKKN